ncbi:hypothetical protein WOLCODRAFT_139030 [Wolfiporia cocos MD-104 SS10]|uniref:Uncharacterized protein n=1 Tax=Wolfiporia cocos (strain MD-104) TaxID=742152 RepID=A0A2H3JQQ9_WOLCO|nr:hypothetical protein WOLCODRAFT_139030 [Wolfiporia cocos MD-104 SS10]
MFQTAPESFPLAHDDSLFVPKALQVIQLTEVPPPPRVRPAAITASSLASSCCTSSSDDSEDESACSSYCSSDPEEEESRQASPDDTYKTRLHRVLVWREKLAKAMGASIAASPTSPPRPAPTPLKRKAPLDSREPDDDDAASHSSKRSRSGSYRVQTSQWTHRRLSAHSCPACDESFSTRQSLEQHGQGSSPNDACRAAVEYGFEP